MVFIQIQNSLIKSRNLKRTFHFLLEIFLLYSPIREIATTQMGIRLKILLFKREQETAFSFFPLILKIKFKN